MTRTEIIEAFLRERERQVSEEGWDERHDDQHQCGELAIAAACYALPVKLRKYARALWPWDVVWYKPKRNRERQLIRAGALLIAELERLGREKERDADESE